MFSSKEIRQITFEKVVRGYRPEDVESFMDKIADEYDSIIKEKQEIEEQLYILAEKIEQYKGEEESIKSTLISAQKLGDNIVNESKQKADAILKEANIRKNDILANAHEELTGNEDNLVRIRKEVSDFKIKVLSMYRGHIESLSAVPEIKREPAKEVTPEVVPPSLPTPVMQHKPVAASTNNIAEEGKITETIETLQDTEDEMEENFDNAISMKEYQAETKKLIDDYVISPETHQGFNNISTLFGK